MSENNNPQQKAYDDAYAKTDLVPFPDHKIEGDEMPLGKLIVSVGGGTGSDLAHLARDNSVHVIDYSAAAAPAARFFGLHPHTLDLNAPGSELPFAPGTVDILVLKDVLEHLMDPKSMLDRLVPLLKKDGTLVISVPNHLTLWGRLGILFGRNLLWKGVLHDHSGEYEEWNYMHIRFFTWAGFQRLLAGSGLRIHRTFFDFGSLGHYFSIPMYAEHLRIKRERGLLTPKGKLFLQFAFPAYRLLDLVFPAQLRNGICSLAPSLFTSCFYVHAKRVPRP